MPAEPGSISEEREIRSRNVRSVKFRPWSRNHSQFSRKTISPLADLSPTVSTALSAGPTGNCQWAHAVRHSAGNLNEHSNTSKTARWFSIESLHEIDSHFQKRFNSKLPISESIVNRTTDVLKTKRF